MFRFVFNAIHRFIHIKILFANIYFGPLEVSNLMTNFCFIYCLNNEHQLRLNELMLSGFISTKTSLNLPTFVGRHLTVILCTSTAPKHQTKLVKILFNLWNL